MPLQDLQQMPPPEGEEASVACLLQGPGEGGECNAEAHDLVAIHDGCHQVQVGNLDIVVDEFLNLTI